LRTEATGRPKWPGQRRNGGAACKGNGVGARMESAAAGVGVRRRRGQRGSLMNVGKRVDYALRALCYLAAQPPARVVASREIKDRQAVPPHFLSKILRRLVAAGFLESVSGAHGGFRLGRSASAISVRDVYECVEGELSLVDCVEHRDGFCCFASACTQRDIWRGAQELLAEYLESISISQIVDQHGLVNRLNQLSRGTSRSP